MGVKRKGHYHSTSVLRLRQKIEDFNSHVPVSSQKELKVNTIEAKKQKEKETLKASEGLSATTRDRA